MTEPSGISLKSVAWFPARKAKPEGGVGATLAKLAVGATVGGLLYASHKPIAAYVVWGIAGGVSAISLASPAARKAIDGALAALGRILGTGIGTVLLTLVFFLVVTPLRFFRRMTGADALHLRDAKRTSYWIECDTEERKVRWAGAMFATEVPPKGGHPLRILVVVVLLLLLVTEGILRLFGFGHPLLYVADPEIGYYPQPNAHLGRYGGRMETNEWGMRSPPVTKEKPAGTFRILMLGDSTLFGGSYMDQDDLYSTHVLHALGKDAPGKVEVLAMGVNGWGPFHERGYVRHFGTFGADLVMIHMPIDDVVRPLYGLNGVPFLPVQTPPTFAWQEVINHLMWRYRAAREGHDDAWESKQAPIGIAEYGNLVDDLKKAGAEVMVFVLPTVNPGYGKPETKEETAWRSGLQATVGQRGVTTYYPVGYFSGKGEPDRVYHDWVHLNPPGHKLYAEFIEGRVREDSARWKAWSTTSAGNAASKEPR